MELFLLFIVLAIFVETTILLIKNHKPLKTTTKRKIYVDTSTLIDQRIVKIAKTGFIGDDLIIPRGVLKELQLLADGKDSEKRNRARAGFEAISELERIVHFNVEILDDEKLNISKVDDELLKLAKDNKGLILTLDFNLLKRADAERIETLNVNDLNLALRNEFLPNEKISIKITEKGSNKGQGVGHLKDGTMVVVDNAAKFVNKTVEVKIVNSYETSAGKIIFAKISNNH